MSACDLKTETSRIDYEIHHAEKGTDLWTVVPIIYANPILAAARAKLLQEKNPGREFEIIRITRVTRPELYLKLEDISK